MSTNIYDDSDYLFNAEGLSVRTLNALYRAEIKTISALKATTDSELTRIRNIGKKCIAEINAAYPDRIRTYEGEAEYRDIYRKIYIIEREVRRILHRMEFSGKKLTEIMDTKFRLSKARKYLADYCIIFPERIADVLSRFEALNDTSDRFYKQFKQAHSLKIQQEGCTYGGISRRKEQELHGDVESSLEK
jgi:hypothetical protein